MNDPESGLPNAPGEIDIVAIQKETVQIKPLQLMEKNSRRHCARCRCPSSFPRLLVILFRVLYGQLFRFDHSNTNRIEGGKHHLQELRRNHHIWVLE